LQFIEIQNDGLPPSCIFLNVSNDPGASHLVANFSSPYKIWSKNLDRRPNYAPKTKFKMTAAAILNLLLVSIMNLLVSLDGPYQTAQQISRQDAWIS